MTAFVDALVTELRTLITNLGKDGGHISPSVYDTAQLLRFHPPEDIKPALTWLLAQQQPDGGWGLPSTPYARDVPTLAAVLALRQYERDRSTQAAVKAGVAFLQLQAEQWAELPIDALPIATEMILPCLVEEALAAGLALKRAPYDALYRLQAQKVRQLGGRSPQPGAAPTYSWEALGKAASSLLPDQSGGIGHSPAATAAWLCSAEGDEDLAEPCAVARRYLAKASAATGLDIPGVVPNVWPIVGFELAYAPYALLVTGLLRQPALRDVVEEVLDKLWVIMQRGSGVSFGEYFTPDADDTGLALAVLQATARPVDPAVLRQFKNGDHFCTFHHELNPSIFANAHALYGLAHAGERDTAVEDFLRARQSTDGRWLADKLHSSWLYTTLEVVLVLSHLGYSTEVKKAVEALLNHRQVDGGWGSGTRSTRAETSYALVALASLHQQGLLDAEAENALQQGHLWLQHHYRPNAVTEEPLWLGKELYTPYRVDRVYELSALLSVGLERMPA
jgi:hypothetical protein